MTVPTRRAAPAVFILAALLLLAAGCRGTSRPVAFYTLTPITAPAAPVPAVGLSVGVGPLTVPRTLDRPQMVIRTGENRLELSEFHRWGGGLAEDMLSTLARDLSALLGTDRVAPYPWSEFLTPDVRIPVDVERFDGAFGGEVVLAATWAVNGPGKTGGVVRRSVIREAVQGRDFGDLAAAHSRALARLAREIAREVGGRADGK